MTTKNNLKNNIRKKFNSAAKSYDQNCIIQNVICKHTIKLLLKYKNHFNDITEFACGTGESTLQLIQHINYQQYHAVDFAKNLLSIAKKKLSQHKNINYILNDFDEKIFFEKSLNLIFCNMGSQWSNNFSKTINLWKKYLSKNGLLLLSMPVFGNFPEFKKKFKLNTPKHKKIKKILSENNCKLITSKIKIFRKTFKGQIEILKFLKATGTNYNKSNITDNHGLSTLKFDQIFLNKKNKQLTYKIGIYLVEKIS